MLIVICAIYIVPVVCFALGPGLVIWGVRRGARERRALIEPQPSLPPASIHRR